MTDTVQIPEDLMKSAEEALDNMLCNCKESCGGTYDGVRAESIKDIAKAILAERERYALIPADLLYATKRLVTEAKLDGLDEKAGWDCWVSMAENAITRAESANAGGSHVTPGRNAHPQPSAVEPVSSSTEFAYLEDVGSGA